MRNILHATAAALVLASLSAAPVYVRGSGARALTVSSRRFILSRDEQEDFKSRVLKAQVQLRPGRKRYGGLSDNELAAVEHAHRMRKDAAEHCRMLLAAARADLQREKQSVNEEALRVSSIGIQSAYRSLKQDEDAWNAAFANHFEATRRVRATLPGGEYGDAAVKKMVSILVPLKAPPGYSRHTGGIAVDFKTVEGGVVLAASSKQNALWKRAWFYKWLVKNASRFKFRPLASEAWHWDYTGR